MSSQGTGKDGNNTFINAQKEFREKKACEHLCLQDFLLAQKIGILVFHVWVFKFPYHIY